MSEKQSYKENYQILENIANKLQSDEMVDVDELIPMVEQATKAYATCKDRLDEVEKALRKRLDNPSETSEDKE